MTKKHKLKGLEIPDCLQTIPSPPKELFIYGELAPLLEKPRLAVVGSRKVTPYGKAVTGQLTREAAEAGIVIISGLALGVDSIAHQATLSASGLTVAVLPSSIENIAPRAHIPLAQRILEQNGALVSEYPQGSEPNRGNFINRNRIVAGLSDAVLITEAAANSGTMHTANFALEQGKPVLVVPGNITSPQSAGTNNLLKSGAIPVTDVEDIFSVLGINKNKTSLVINAANEQEFIILSLIQEGTSDGHELLAKSELDAAVFNQTLTMLEITGKIKALGSNHWAKL